MKFSRYEKIASKDKDLFYHYVKTTFYPCGGTWIDRGIDTEKDFYYTITVLLTKDIAENGNKEIPAILSGFLKGSLTSQLTRAYRENVCWATEPITDLDNRVYEIFARLIAAECKTNYSLKEKIISMYVDRYNDEYNLVQEYAKTFAPEFNNPKEASDRLHKIYQRAIYGEDDPYEIRRTATVLFMTHECLELGRILPYAGMSEIFIKREESPYNVDFAETFNVIFDVIDRISGCESDKEEKARFALDAAADPLEKNSLGLFLNQRPDSKFGKQRKVLMDKYIRDRYKLVADYIGCSTDPSDNKKTAEMLAAKLWDIGYETKDDKIYVFKVVADRSCVSQGHAEKCFEDSKDKDREEYIDLMSTTILPMYYFKKLQKCIETKIADGTDKQITRREFIRELAADDIGKDAEFLINISYIAAAFRASNDIYDLYLRSINITKGGNIGESRLHSLYKDELINKTRNIEMLYEEVDSLNEVIKTLTKKSENNKNLSKEDKGLIKEIATLKDVISDKDDEINDLQKRNAELLEYIETLEGDDNDAEELSDVVVDMNALRKYRYAFVCCDIDVMYPGLRKKFPNSVFIENLSTPTAKSGIKGVIFITKHISHSLYFKMKGEYEGVPMMYFTRRNPDEMYKQMTKEFLLKEPN